MSSIQKGIKVRLLAHEILISLKEKHLNLDEILNTIYSKNQLSINDKKMLYSIILTSMRYNLYIKKIISKYIKKKIKKHQYILFLSAITQIVYLDFKEYAVVNSSVEIAKNNKVKIYPGFVNAVLKKICKDKISLKKTNISFNDFPDWFEKETVDMGKEQRDNFLRSITEKPNLHIVFKETIPDSFKKLNIIKTTENSLICLEGLEINKLPEYAEGEWWVQDYSTMLPLYLIKDLKNKKVLDMCAAPGGKSFQALSNFADVDMYEINKNRAKILSINLKRLKYNTNFSIKNSLNINSNKKYDYILIDAPCSAVGTVRRNPEIFFREKTPNFSLLAHNQEKLLNKAKELVKEKGIIIYMVCSFLPGETVNLVEKFLNKNKNFKIEKYLAGDEKLINTLGCIEIIPKQFKNFNIDGFFAVKLINNG